PAGLRHRGPYGITVSHDENRFSTCQLGHNVVIPIWEQTIDDVLEAFGAWNVLTQQSVAFVAVLGKFFVVIQHWRWSIVRATPGHELFVAVLFTDFGFVHTL